MRHTLILNEGHETIDRASRQPKITGRVAVDFEYVQTLPVDALAERVIEAFANKNLKNLKKALAEFVQAGFDPGRLRMSPERTDNGDLNLYKSFAPKALIEIAWEAKHWPMVKALVEGGVSPFDPFNVILEAVLSENGPSSAGRTAWVWLMDRTSMESWLREVPISARKKGFDLVANERPASSMVHEAIVAGKFPVIEAMIERWGGANVLRAQGPALLPWLENQHKSITSASPMAQSLKSLMVRLETSVLNDVRPSLNGPDLVRSRL